MKLVMTLLVRDGADILRANLEYHLDAGVDYFIVTDNNSTDPTTDILREYAGRGCLLCLHEPEHTYNQAAWVTRMVRIAAARFDADWVINNDVDEFWWPENGGDLHDILEAVPASSIGLHVPRHNFVPRPSTNGNWFLAELRYRETVSLNYVGNPLPTKVCHRAMPDISVGHGCHAIFRDGERIDTLTTDQICIFHFPFRSREQFTNKVIQGGGAYARSGLPSQVGYAVRDLYEIYLRGEFDAYLDEVVLDDEAIAAALADGSLVEDTRLRDLFEQHGLAR